MLIRLIRNQPQGTAITGRLVINGRFFCNTIERKGYEIPALCYPVRVTMSSRFKRLLPIVQNVPQRSGIRIHRGSKPEHSNGCVLVVGDNNNSPLSSKYSPVGARSVAEVENQLTQLLLQSQNDHEAVILEVIDFRPGTEYGYNTPCPIEIQKR